MMVFLVLLHHLESRGKLLDAVQNRHNRTAHTNMPRSRREQSHRTSLCSLRYTVLPEHKKNGSGFIRSRLTGETNPPLVFKTINGQKGW